MYMKRELNAAASALKGELPHTTSKYITKEKPAQINREMPIFQGFYKAAALGNYFTTKGNIFASSHQYLPQKMSSLNVGGYANVTVDYYLPNWVIISTLSISSTFFVCFLIYLVVILVFFQRMRMRKNFVLKRNHKILFALDVMFVGIQFLIELLVNLNQLDSELLILVIGMLSNQYNKGIEQMPPHSVYRLRI